MELNVLKSVFFVGEENRIEEFVANLKPRCIQASNVMVHENGGIYRTVYNSENDTYISPSMTEYFKSPVSGNYFPVSTRITINLHRNEWTYNRNIGARRGHYVKTAILSSEELNDYYVLIGKDTNVYARKDHDGLTTYINGDEKYYTVCYEDSFTIPDHYNYSVGYTYDAENESFDCVQTDLYHESMLTTVSTRRDGTYQVLTSFYEENPTLFETCAECGRHFLVSEHMLNEEHKCSECANPRMKIHGYHRWYGTFTPHYAEGEENVPTFGTEVETQGPDSNSRYVYPMRDLWHLERDASIGQGFEMISQPMSLAYVKAHKEELESMFTNLSDNGQRAHDARNCGLHVHINRSAFKNNRSIQRLKAMVHGMRHEMEKFARRCNSNYYSYYGLSSRFDYDEVDRIHDSGHSVAVNSRGNQSGDKNTVEIRIFKSTLNITTYLATLEFVSNLVTIANDETKTIVKFGDLLHGEYIDQYIEQRHGFSVDFNNDAMIDFGFADSKEALDKMASGRITRVEFMSAMESFADSRLVVEGGR